MLCGFPLSSTMVIWRSGISSSSSISKTSLRSMAGLAMPSDRIRCQDYSTIGRIWSVVATSISGENRRWFRRKTGHTDHWFRCRQKGKQRKNPQVPLNCVCGLQLFYRHFLRSECRDSCEVRFSQRLSDFQRRGDHGDINKSFF